MNALRVLLAFEFLAGLGAWAVNAATWPLAGAVMTGTLITFLLTWGDEPRNVCSQAPDLRARRRPWPGGHIAHQGARGFWCNGPGTKYPCRDCIPESE